MAGAGWRDFIPGEVLTAANVQDYLQDQAVMVFASAAARTSAIASPTEGMISYLKNSNLIEAYDGSAWKQIGATTGAILNVKYKAKTDTQSASTASKDGFLVTGLDIAHAVKSTSNSVLLIANISSSGNDTNRPTAVQIRAGGTDIVLGGAAGTRGRTASGNHDRGQTTSIQTTTVAVLYTPGSTSSITYQPFVVNANSETSTLYVNRTQTDADSADYARYVSTFMLLEVAG